MASSEAIVSRMDRLIETMTAGYSKADSLINTLELSTKVVQEDNKYLRKILYWLLTVVIIETGALGTTSAFIPGFKSDLKELSAKIEKNDTHDNERFVDILKEIQTLKTQP